jgi:hypothetical protein
LKPSQVNKTQGLQYCFFAKLPVQTTWKIFFVCVCILKWDRPLN